MSTATTRIALKIRTAGGRRKTVCQFRKLNPADLPAGHAARTAGGFADNQWHVFSQSLRVNEFEPKDSEFAFEYYKYARDSGPARGLPAVEENLAGFTFLDATGNEMFTLNRETLARLLDGYAAAGYGEIDLDTLRQANDRP